MKIIDGMGLAGLACVLLLLLHIAVNHYHASESVFETGNYGIQKQAFSEEKAPPTARKSLLALRGNGTDEEGGDGEVSGGDDDAGGQDLRNRIGGGQEGASSSTCSKENILIFQGPSSIMFNSIPTYEVEVQNLCVPSGGGSCRSISNIHLRCGWFSSVRLINPRIFRRLNYDDCLVKDGEALSPGESLSFKYANSLAYDLSVSSISC